MREILSIQIGECGNRVGSTFWKELCSEHSLDAASGHRLPGYKEAGGVGESLDVFFDENKDGCYLPRAVLTDLDSGAIDSIFSGPNGRLFREEYAVSGYSGTGGNYAKGKYEGSQILEIILDTVRKSMESCDSFQGFQLFHSAAGGTGSGLSSILMDELRSEFIDKMFSSVTVMPTKNVSDGVLAPYNSILQLQNLVEFVDYVKFYDNEAVYNICRNKIELEKANLEDVNKVIAQSLCAETCSFRFNGFVNNDMRKLATNMIPFPRIHFLVSSMAPLGKQIKGMDNTDIQLTDIVRQLLVPSHFLASLNPKEGRYYTCSATFRGDFTTSNAENELFRTCIYQSSYFHEWIPNNFQSSYCKVAQQGFKRSGSLLASSSAMSNYLKFTSEEFSKLFRRKAFVNWYLAEGMDEMEFTEAESNVNDVISEYIPYYSYYNDTDEEEGPQPDEMSY